MHFAAFRYLPVFLLFIHGFGQLEAQDNRYSFFWNNRNAARLAGEITLRSTLQPDKTTLVLDLGVVWYDPNGNPLTTNQPVLYLSRYDLDIVPEKSIRCLTFDSDKKFELKFQQNGRLIFLVQDGFSGDVKLKFGFQYALSLESCDKGDLMRIRNDKGNGIEFSINIPALPKTAELANQDKNQTRTISETDQAVFTRLRQQFQTAADQLAQFNTRKSRENIEERSQKALNSAPGGDRDSDIQTIADQVTRFITDIELYLSDIDRYRASLNRETLPADTLNQYLDRYTDLRDEAVRLRSIYFRINLGSAAINSAQMDNLAAEQRDSLQLVIKTKFVSEFLSIKDSALRMLEQVSDNARLLNPVLESGRRNVLRSLQTDSLIETHQLYTELKNELSEQHSRIWTQYRNEIAGMDLIPEIERLHGDFSSIEQQVDSSLAATQKLINLNQKKLNPATGLTGYWPLWTGLAMLVLITIVIASRNAGRKRLMQEIEARPGENGSAGLGVGRSSNGDIIAENLADQFYTVDLLEKMPESVIGKIHYSFGAIKTIYQLIHGAFLDKKPGDFGGFLFGSQYRLGSVSGTRYEIIIEKVCSSKSLRPDILNDMNARADLVDEMDEMVRQNKKFLLLGWFTSSADSSLEMKEGLMKIHRTFFKEKWQLGICTNPGSEELTSAVFIRRKTGYFDPFPDPASFVRFEEMYRYSLNQPANLKTPNAQPERDINNYRKLEFSSGWTDTLVHTMYFHKEVVKEIIHVSGLISTPSESFQPVGYLYGTEEADPAHEGKTPGFSVFIDRFIELTNETAPREIPGYRLLGWWGQSKAEIFNYLPAAITYHQNSFKEAYQIACLVNSDSKELRVFTRKASREMNNSVVETEEFNLSQLV
jgi:hypothetical protein